MSTNKARLVIPLEGRCTWTCVGRSDIHRYSYKYKLDTVVIIQMCFIIKPQIAWYMEFKTVTKRLAVRVLFFIVSETLNSTIRLVNHTQILKFATNVSTPWKNDTIPNTAPSDAKTVNRQKKETVQVVARHITKSQKGILTRDVYTAGHAIPNPELCPELGEAMKLLILITSSPDHGEQRMAIRQTWGHFGQRKDIGVAFVLGMSKVNQINEAIKAEMDMYGDIIQAKFVDAYDNLTLKTVSMFEWVDSYCSLVPFVLKTDDDMFINIPKLLAVTEKYNTSRRTIFGRLAKKWKPIRKSSSKYYVSVNIYPQSFFPDFTTGPAYLVTKDAIHDLYNTALSSTFLKLEDVFMTGIVAQNIGVKRVHINEFYNKRIPYNVCNIRKSISIHMVKYHEQFMLWEKLHDNRVRCK